MPTDWSDNITISQLADEPALSEELNTLIDGIIADDVLNIPHVVLNFGAVSYVNSSNIAQLLRLRKLLNESDRMLRLCSVGDGVWSVLLVTGLDKVFQFAPDPMTAIAGLQLEEDGKEGSG